MANVALTRGHSHLRPVGFAFVLACSAVVTLALTGATNPFAITILPAAAAASGFVVEEYDGHRRRHAAAALHRHVRAGLVGTVVFLAAILVATAT